MKHKCVNKNKNIKSLRYNLYVTQGINLKRIKTKEKGYTKIEECWIWKQNWEQKEILIDPVNLWQNISIQESFLTYQIYVICILGLLRDSSPWSPFWPKYLAICTRKLTLPKCSRRSAKLQKAKKVRNQEKFGIANNKGNKKIK